MFDPRQLTLALDADPRQMTLPLDDFDDPHKYLSMGEWREALVHDAAIAQEIFGDDELERFAAEQ